MRFCVSAQCVGCGLCADTCPEVFSMTDDGTAQSIAAEVPAQAEASALDAMQSCPVSAIEQA